MPGKFRLLIVEDSVDDSELLIKHLENHGVIPDYQRVETRPEFLSALSSDEWDTVICDYNLPSIDPLELISTLKARNPDLPCIVVSGSIGEDRAVETLKAGASDYIMKDNLLRLVPAIKREVKESRNRRERKTIEASLRRTEEDLRQTQKLESIGQLAGGIAHDFNNILSTILLQSDILLEVMDEKTSQEDMQFLVKTGLAEIKASSERAKNLTQQLLTFSRKKILQRQIVNLNEIISSLMNMFEKTIEENIEVRTHLLPNLKNVQLDPVQIEQICINLVVNSRDAMPDGGLILIETANVQVDDITAKKWQLNPGLYVQLSVSDTGEGMGREVLEKIYDPFFTTKPVGKGTGLGLSTVHGIVQQNNGRIFVESERHKGTVFKIYLPVSSEGEKIEVTAPQKNPSLRGNEKILVVEDELALRNLLAKTLAKKGYNISLAADGMEAYDKFKERLSEFAIIITDVVMPRMSGPEFAQLARGINPNINILFQSGYAADSKFGQSIDIENVHFLEKPYTSETLLKKIRTILC